MDNNINNLIKLYGFTQDPNTLDYMIVMRYVEDGSLRKSLQNITKDKWIMKLSKLKEIISGLNTIHQQKLVHCDLHHGNILNQKNRLSISDLGLCKPVQYFQSLSRKNNVYGVLPFIAPEILRGKPYTTSGDIYSFSMIMWEFISGIPPFDDRAHNLQLSISICKGERPEIIENIPQCYIDLMKNCWDKDSMKRPNGFEIEKIIDNWISDITKDEKSKNITMEFYKADKILEEKRTDISDIINNKTHPQAYRTSRLINFTEKLDKILNQSENSLSPQSEGFDCIISD